MDVQMLVVQGRPRCKCLRFPCGEFVFGRGPECHVRPDSPSVSRQHCLLRVSAGGVRLRDLGSANGTLVNGSRIRDEQPLADGDLVQLGPLVLQIHVAPEPSRSPSSNTVTATSDAAELLPQLP